MERTESRRPGQRLATLARRFRPRLELLEERLQLGDTILGLSAVALWGLDVPSVDTAFVLDSGEHECDGHPGLFRDLDAVASLSLTDGRNHEASNGSLADPTVPATAAEAASG